MTIKWDQHSHNMLQGNLNWIWNFAQYLENSFLWAVIGAHSQLSEPSHCLDFLPQMKAPHTRVSESENQFSHSPHRCFHDDLCVHGLRLWAASAKLWMIGSDIGDIAEKFFFFFSSSLLHVVNCRHLRHCSNKTLTLDSNLSRLYERLFCFTSFNPKLSEKRHTLTHTVSHEKLFLLYFSRVFMYYGKLSIFFPSFGLHTMWEIPANKTQFLAMMDLGWQVDEKLFSSTFADTKNIFLVILGAPDKKGNKQHWSTHTKLFLHQ